MTYPKNILLVEDDEDDQLFFINALSQIKNASLQGICNNGEEAVYTLKNCTPLPDLIFMDINMPRMSGIECLVELQKNALLKSIPVIMLSSSIDDKTQLLEIGAKDFIQKTPNESTLYHKMRQLINFNFSAALVPGR